MTSNQLSARELEELKKYYREIEGLTQQAADAEVQRAQALGQARQELDRLRREYADLTSDVTASLTAFQRIVEEITKQNVGLKDSVKAYKNLTSLAEKIQYHQKGISKMSANEIVNLKSQIEKEKQRLENSQDLLRSKEAELSNNEARLQQEIAAATARINTLRSQGQLTQQERYERRKLEDQLKRNNNELFKTQDALTENQATLDGTNIAYNGLVATAEELNKELGFAGRLAGKLGDIPGIGKSLSGAAESFAKWGEGVFIIGKLIEGFNSLNKAQVEFGRETGRNIEHLDTLNMTLISSSDYIKTATALSKQFGANADAIFTKATLQEATEMVNLMGMGAEEAGKLARFSRLSGNDLKTSNISVGKQLESFNKTNRTGISLAANFRDIANTSDAIAMSLGGNAAKIGLANAEARKLGLSLDQVDKIASSLLNFEDSISAELEAELLTGKQINLEQARLYALNNDIVGLTREIGTNQDLINSFAGSNRIQQEAIAKSLGLGREEMAKMIYDQRNINGLSDEQLQKVMGVGSEELKRLSVQESINKSIEKMTEALAGPLDMLAQMLFTGERLKIVFGLVAGILAGRMVASLVTAASSMVATVVAAKAYNSALNQGLTKEAALTAMKVAGAEAVSFGAVTASIVGGLAVVAGAIAAFSSMKDGKINKLGKPILFTGTDTVKIEPNDSIYAAKDGSMKVGTNLLGNDKFSKAIPTQPTETPSIAPKSQEITPTMANPESLNVSPTNTTTIIKESIQKQFEFDYNKMAEAMRQSPLQINTSVQVDKREIATATNEGNLTNQTKVQ